MHIEEFQRTFQLNGKVFGIRRVKDLLPSGREMIPNACTVTAFKSAMEGKTVYLTAENALCKGSLTGLGFRDGLPPIPGGYGNFLACGAQGGPPPHRLNRSPEAAEALIWAQPQRVMEGYDGLEIKPYRDGDTPDLVTIFCDADRLSAMCYLFNFSKDGGRYDTIIVPTVSGCASIFRVPFGELEREEPRAVVGLADLSARIHFTPELLALTVTGQDFKRMLADADASFISTKEWKTIQERISVGPVAVEKQEVKQ